MTKGQQEDLETIRFFIPAAMRHIEITDQDVKAFFELSEHGKHGERVGLSTMDGFNALVQGKRWRGIHMEMWEEGMLEKWVNPHTKEVTYSCSVPYACLLDGLPRSVMEFAAKEMFKGKDKELIYTVWEEINSSKEGV